MVHDPFLDPTWAFTFDTTTDLYGSIKGSDCVILSTDHSAYKEIDFERVKKIMIGDLVIDVRGMFDPDKVKACGLRYKGSGRILF